MGNFTKKLNLGKLVLPPVFPDYTFKGTSPLASFWTVFAFSQKVQHIGNK